MKARKGVSRIGKMEEITEKFTIKITDQGLIITAGKEKTLSFTAGEALMLLDILKNEESKLRQVAHENSPLPISIKF